MRERCAFWMKLWKALVADEILPDVVIILYTQQQVLSTHAFKHA